MKLRFLLTGIAIGIVPMLLLGTVSAQEGEGDGMKFGPPEWTKKTQEHTDMAKGAGEWDFTMSWNTPTGPATGKGTSTAKMTLDGYYMTEDSKGSFNMMGREIPMVGKLYIGFDTVSKEYFAIWMSASSPVPSISRGPMKDGVITLEGNERDYMSPTGAKKKVKLTLTFDSDDKHTLKFFEPKPDGGWKEAGEMVYTRKADGCGCGQ